LRPSSESRALAATRHLAGRLALARTQAVGRAATIALRFDVVNGAVVYAVFADRNRNGVRTKDINRRDRPSDRSRDCPRRPVSTGGDRQRDHRPTLGWRSIERREQFAVITPAGTATAGSLYIRGADRSQYAIRVLGATGSNASPSAYDEKRREWVAIF
jgi:hypothetical protein